MRRIEAIEARLSPPETLKVEMVLPGETTERPSRMTICFELSDPGLLGIPVSFTESVDCWS